MIPYSYLLSCISTTNVLALAIDPSMPTTLYAGTNSNGVYKSTDGGASWSAVTSGLIYLSVRALAIDPTAPNTLYAGTNGGVFKSADGGASWNPTGAGPTSVRTLTIAPTASNTLYTATEGGGVFKSTDYGATWSAINTGLTNKSVRALAIDPTPPTRSTPEQTAVCSRARTAARTGARPTAV